MEDLSRASVVLVDDEPAVRQGVGQALESAGYRVTRCRDGFDAISWLQEHPAPRLLIGDVHMPGIEGYELRSRAREIHGHLPVLLITGDAYIGTRPDDGPDGGPLLRKPFTREDLLRAVAACLAEARASTPEQPAPKDTAPARTASAGVHDSPLEELPRALHELNNSLAAALGRIEICEDAAEQMDGGPHLSLNLCLHEAGQALVRASGRVQRIAELTRGAQPLSQLDDLPLAHLDQLDPPRPPGSAGGAIAPTPSDPVYAPSRQE